jgi:alpha-methylacyl-CoA racemase
LRVEMGELFATRCRDDWANLFAAVDCCVTPILSPEEALANVQIAARQMVFSADGLTQFAPPLKISGFDFSIRQPAPKAGEHTMTILAAAGYTAVEIDRLAGAGAFG